MTDPASDFDHNAASFYLDPAAAFSEIRRRSPVLYSSNYGGYWILTRFEDVHRALLDWQRFSSEGVDMTSVHENWPPTRAVRELPIASDPPAHTRYRAVVAPWFARRHLMGMAAPLRREARRLLENVASSGVGDVVQDFALPLVLHGLARFLRRPIAETELWLSMAEGIFLGRAAARNESDRARIKLLEWVEHCIGAAPRSDSDDFFALLDRAEVDGRRLDHDEMVGFGSLAFLAGVETTVNAVANTFHHLATHPAHLERLSGDRSLIPSAIEELLRLRAPVQLLGRVAATDIDMGDMAIGRGERVAVCYGAANGDETIFPDAAACILGRSPNAHLAFGAGRHKCLGSNLARLEIRVAVEEALDLWGSWELAAPHREMPLPRGDLHGYWRLPVRVHGVTAG